MGEMSQTSNFARFYRPRIVGIAHNPDSDQCHMITARDLLYLQENSNLELDKIILKDINLKYVQLSPNPITRFGQEHDLPDFIRGLLSLPAGIYGFGEWMGRRTGFRDWQIGSVVLGDYEKEKAKEELEYTKKMITFIIKNDKARNIFSESLVKYIKEKPSYFAGRFFAGGAIGKLAGGPTSIAKVRGAITSGAITAVSTSGTLLLTAQEIDDFAKAIIIGE
jgi:hypothetical protein